MGHRSMIGVFMIGLASACVTLNFVLTVGLLFSFDCGYLFFRYGRPVCVLFLVRIIGQVSTDALNVGGNLRPPESPFGIPQYQFVGCTR